MPENPPAPTPDPHPLGRVAALLYLTTWITSVVAVVLYGGSALDSTAGLSGRTPVLVGSLLEVVLAVAVVGTSLALFPLLPHTRWAAPSPMSPCAASRPASSSSGSSRSCPSSPAQRPPLRAD